MKIPVERIFSLFFFSFNLLSKFHLGCILVVLYGSPFTKSVPDVTVKAATVFLIFYIFFTFSCMQQISKMKGNSALGLGFNRYLLHHQ